MPIAGTISTMASHKNFLAAAKIFLVPDSFLSDRDIDFIKNRIHSLQEADLPISVHGSSSIGTTPRRLSRNPNHLRESNDPSGRTIRKPAPQPPTPKTQPSYFKWIRNDFFLRP
jgi:hypothetical protein